jgi:hypothetical protein
MNPLDSIFHFAFGCHHRRRSGVFTIKKRTYQVCLWGGIRVFLGVDALHTIERCR